MDWQEASAYYEAKLTDALNVQRHALNLANLPQTGISEDEKNVLIDEGIPAKKQLERLKKREFRIAVVGLEKAGKSTFVNAWLDCDLLPAKGGRCTFTTTQIFSVQTDDQQVLAVKAKTPAQFSQLQSDLKLAAQTEENAKKDLETISRYATTLQQVIDEGNKEIPFSRLEDLKEPLQKYVADERFAHAVDEIWLYTNKLAQAEGVVFYDVPGLDSGLAKHVEESKEMLADCDAVIVVQRFSNLREAELCLIKFTEEGDRNVKVADKLFAFLSNIDLQGTADAISDHIAEAKADWTRHANLPEHRIVAGTAGSHLVLSGVAGEQTLKAIGSPEAVRQKLEGLTGIGDRDQLLNQVTGIREIKSRVNAYINNERVDVLKKRCGASISRILTTSESIRTAVSKRYSDNPADAKRQEEDSQRINFAEWWASKWEKIVAELADYYDLNIRPSDRTHKNSDQLISPSKIQVNFHVRYLAHVDELFSAFKEKAAKRREIIFKQQSVIQFDSQETNFEWREELFADISQMLQDISKELALELRQEATELVEYISSLMWNSPEVKLRLIEDADNYVEALDRSLSVLFLRFARPMVEALVRSPVDSEKRSSIIKRLGPDIEILDNYYSGESPEFKTLKRFANYGMKLLYDLTIREKVLGIQEIIEIVEIAGQAAQPALTPEALLIREVEADLKAVEVYLKEAIFEAAGFRQYCSQELDRLRDKFINSQAVWSGVATNEWLGENPLLLSELPDNLKKLEVNLEVSDRLRQLTIALDKAKRITSVLAEPQVAVPILNGTPFSLAGAIGN